MRSIPATYENGVLKLRGKLPLRNHAKVRILYEWPTSVAKRTQGLLRVPRRVARLVAESDEFSALDS
ncbi:MAG: antitoxin family protein [Planctomycetota bacterium]